MRVLLDTCAFIWLTTDAPELTAKAKDIFQNPDNSIVLSVVSIWEILVKHGIGKLALPAQPEAFIAQQCEQHFIDILSLNYRAVLQLESIPSLHRDPFDRMLVCQAIEHGLTILTPDHYIAQYPVATLW
jgi:PIN domain nuclease of toxin-antitoxin system